MVLVSERRLRTRPAPGTTEVLLEMVHLQPLRADGGISQSSLTSRTHSGTGREGIWMNERGREGRREPQTQTNEPLASSCHSAPARLCSQPPEPPCGGLVPSVTSTCSLSHLLLCPLRAGISLAPVLSGPQHSGWHQRNAQEVCSLRGCLEFSV